MRDLRSTAKHSRDPLPIGTVVIRVGRRGGRAARACRRSRYKVRWIKVRNSGPMQKRWMRYARWWWLKNRGPIPTGLRVIHADGDSLNDDPSNYVLGTPADAAFLWHDRNPEASAANYVACAAATKAMNQQRKRIRRAVSLLQSWWYPVDFAGKRVLNRPVRKRWMVWGERSAGNGKGGESRAVGWPGMPFLAAAALEALARGDARGRAELRERVLRLRALYWPHASSPLHVGSISWALCWLRARGLVMTTRRRHLPALYRITAKAIGLRGPVSPWVPRRGCDVERECVGFARVEDREEAHA